MTARLTSASIIATLSAFAASLLLSFNSSGAESQREREAKILGTQAERLVVNDQPKLAITYLNRAIAIAPQCPELYTSRAEAYNKIFNYQQAVMDCNKALALNPNLPEAYRWRGWAFDQLDNFAAAVRDYRKCLSFPSINRFTRDSAGCCLADNLGQMGKEEEAIQALDKVIKDNPRCGIARKARGNLLNNDRRNPKQAITDFTIAIEEKVPDYRDVYRLRARAYTRLKDYSKAVADYTTSLQLSPDDDNILRQRAQVYEQMGDFKMAIKDYSAGIERNPEGAGPHYFGRARCYKKLGQNALAQKDLDECKRLDYSGK